MIHSGYLLAESNQTFGALQRAPDNRIYLAINDSQDLGVIDYPDQLDSRAGFNPNGFHLHAGFSGLGLPVIPAILENENLITSGSIDTTICAGDTLLWTGKDFDLTYLWSDGLTASSRTFSEPGNFV